MVKKCMFLSRGVMSFICCLLLMQTVLSPTMIVSASERNKIYPVAASGSIVAFSNGFYRTIRINCPVDVEVTDKEGIVVANIINDMPVDLGDEGLIAGNNQNDEKYVIVPIEENYNVKITAREDCVVNYGIDEEFILGGNAARIINYFDINLKKGQSLTGAIPRYPYADEEEIKEKGSTAEYTLADPENKPIQVSSELRGEKAKAASYVVDVDNSDRRVGFTSGGGVHNYGSFAKASVFIWGDYEFKGWYDNRGKCFSRDKEYRFCVKSNVKLIAKYTKKKAGKSEQGSAPKDNTGENKSKDISELDAYLEKIKYLYDGKVKKPVVTFEGEGITLEEGKQYSAEYVNNKNVGTATVTITGIGEYTGTIIRKFTIFPKTSKLTKIVLTKKGIKLNWKKRTEQADGYQIQYTTYEGVEDNKFINKNKTTSYTITNLNSRGYSIRIRTYKAVDGKKYYSSWSEYNAVTVKLIK